MADTAEQKHFLTEKVEQKNCMIEIAEQKHYLTESVEQKNCVAEAAEQMGCMTQTTQQGINVVQATQQGIDVTHAAQLNVDVTQTAQLNIDATQTAQQGIGITHTSSKIDSLIAIEKLRTGDQSVLKHEKWLMYLSLTSESNINFERLNSLEEIKNNYVLNYVEKTLIALNSLELSEDKLHIIEEVLKWSEIAKSGLTHHRNKWIKRGYNLFAHNVGSAQIYMEESSEVNATTRRIVHDLILTHGLIGQYIRGEVPLSDNKNLYSLIEEGIISADELKELLKALNFCIVSAVNMKIWENICEKVDEIIELIISGHFDKQYSLKDRIRCLRAASINNGENFEIEYEKLRSNTIACDKIAHILKTADLWYVEAALYDFSFLEFIP